MKEYQGKTAEEALANAAEELNVSVDELIYIVSKKKKGLFSKKVVVEVFETSDVIKYAEDYILEVIDNLEIESSVKSTVDNDIIRITIDSAHNPVLIGKNGKTLQALNELTKLAVSNHFHKRFRILLDINGYKDSKYIRLSRVARRAAHDVQKTHEIYTFDPMPADERRAVHNACAGMKNIRTESIGEGTHRQVQIIYVD
ncbi:MAG: KH domain-containing protein [Erysipelotrichaceae bacterium]|jgi:spoIIIJ-associated protein|nr:Jag N-terminal domain-containing protein [Bacilli bacterium]NLV29261.1 KH domain-containing protein [Erysipelotrichaceae bacterium]HPY79726.1 R3H domain-containing nucleic acid-binding protein [Bacilli bacterium]HQA55633.1 R3H domain-containing nucleic acid-binding protein [Bacilli bacterium]